MVEEFAMVIEKEIERITEATKVATEYVEKNCISTKLSDLDKPILQVVEKKETQESIDDYINNLKNVSEFPETIDSNIFNADTIDKTLPEEVKEKRTEFNNYREKLIKQWEEKNNTEWPKYEEDVYSKNGNKIREKGQYYDAHHIQPLEMGGENTVDNITPIHAESHYDKQGVHSPDSPYNELRKIINEV